MSSVAQASAVFGRRACAVLAAASAVLHAVMLSHAANPVVAVVLAAMIVACLFCARDLWRWGSLRAWCVVALMNLFMIALHLPAPAHHHGDGASTAVVEASTLLMAATLIAAIEVTAAVAVLYYRTRGRSVGISGTPAR